jgi:OFA family oxalate/formate antiporter-like MFS transporter
MMSEKGSFNKNKVPKARYAVIIVASILVMLCSGAVYAWSIFVAPLQEEFGFSTAQTQMVYGLIIGIFTIAMLFVNKILRRFGPRVSALTGGVLFFAGYMAASASNGNLWMLIAGMSILSGTGMAFGYVTVLNNLVKWFPENKGLATGLAVSGFGGGAILLSQIARPLLAGGWEVLDIFRVVGIIYGVLFVAGALVLTVPPGYKPEPGAARVEAGKLLKDRQFWVLFYVFFAGTFAGLLFNGNLKPLGESYGVSAGAAVLGISLFSIGNAAGRILWGQVHDMIGGKKAVVASLGLLTIFMILLPVGSRSDLSFIMLTLFLGLSFGANFVTYAADVADRWGIARLDIIYPAVSVAYGIAGIAGPIAGGMIRDITGSYHSAIIAGALVCLTGIAAYAFLMPQRKDSRYKMRNPGQIPVDKIPQTGGRKG